MANTAEAKKRYTEEDLYLRGSQLIATSYKHGVTSMRAFVEVDTVTELKTLEVGIRLKREFASFGGFVDVQICVFAQDPVFSTEQGEANRALFEKAIVQFGSEIDVIGTMPYVETDLAAKRQNKHWAIETALKHGKHLDFQTEFSLEGNGTHMSVFEHIIEELKLLNWPTYPGAPTVVLGYATRLTRATRNDLLGLSRSLRETRLPVHFVGLPTSDLYMKGRHGPDYSEQDEPLSRPCGTIIVPKLIQDYGINACLSVNNVGNPFTPHGNGDPLGIASWGVGLFHAGRVEDAKILYEAISTRAMDAIAPSEEGCQKRFIVEEGKPLLPMLLFRNEENIEITSASWTTIEVPARQRLRIQDVVWDPPETQLRSIIR
jgi:hypothetical protein